MGNAYVSAFNAKQYIVAAVIALSGLAITVVTFAAGFQQSRLAYLSELALTELQGRMAEKLGMSALRFHIPRKATFAETPFVYIPFIVAALLSAAAVTYALIH